MNSFTWRLNELGQWTVSQGDYGPLAALHEDAVAAFPPLAVALRERDEARRWVAEFFAFLDAAEYEVDPFWYLDSNPLPWLDWQGGTA